MIKMPVIAIFDVGKTNKKLFLFDEQYRIVHEQNIQLSEIKDEDGSACEDIKALTNWVKDSFASILADEKFEIKAVNFSAYGASFVYLDENGTTFLPLYNYLKPFPKELQNKFYKTYGGEKLVAKQTASPVLGNLNSGMQLYRLKYEMQEAFDKIKWALHLPQYLSYILSSEVCTDITSIGCHTNLWSFKEQQYHEWVSREGIEEKFPSIKDSTTIAGKTSSAIAVGIGLHDSSAALIPYLYSFTEPFVLLSTGTWCITLNPFNDTLLTDQELEQDCLCYLSYKGKPVKASRLFAGYEHEQQVKRIAEHFKKPIDHYWNIKCDPSILNELRKTKRATSTANDHHFEFQARDINAFSSYEEAYHQLMMDIMSRQVKSSDLVLKDSSIKRIFVDGGFSQNAIFMYLLAEAYPDIEVYAATTAQASALGAALAIHEHWNKKEIPDDIIKLKRYTVTNNTKV